MEKIIITFNTTSHAMALDFFSKDKNFPGKLIPIPNKLSAGCGLAWEICDTNLCSIKEILDYNKIAYDNIYLLDF